MYIVSTLGLSKEYRNMIEEECGVCVEHIERIAELSDKELGRVEILLTYGDNMPEELVRKMKSLKWVHSGQAGVEAMPGKLLAEMGVKVTNSRGINSITIAEYVMCMLLNLERNTYAFYEAFKKKTWDTVTRLDELEEKTISVLGLGNVGMQIAKRAKAFDMKVVGVDLSDTASEYVDVFFTPDRIDEAAKISDYLIVCMPLTEQTRHMIDGGVLKNMKPSAVVVNVGRGPIVKTEDLVRALEEEKIRAAILDVLEEEPLPENSCLWDVKNLIITPHIAGDRQKSYMPRMMNILCGNLNAYPDFDKMVNHVNIERGF